MDLGWVSFSRSDTNKMLGLLDALRTPGAVDEIGIGIIRDGFADLFFPGTSTVQTRAKYFILVPFLLKEQCEDKVYSADAIKSEQINCAQYMLKNSKNKIFETSEDNFEDEGGIIGSRIMSEQWLKKDVEYKRTHWLARTPAEIYWSGLREYKIFNGNLINRDNLSFPGYLSEAVDIKKELDENKKQEKANNRRKHKDDSENKIRSLWDFNYKTNNSSRKIENVYYADWCSNNLRIELSRKESEYLYYKITDSKSKSLLVYILEKNIDILDANGNFLSFEELSKKCSNWPYNNGLLELANNFNELVYRLKLRYNIELFKDNKDVIWPKNEWDTIKSTPLLITKEQIEEIFKLLKIGNKYNYLKEFLINSLTLLNIPSEKNMEELANILMEHEIRIKKGTLRSKLFNKDTEPPANGSLIGGGRLDYRFHSAARIIYDIRNPVEI